MRTTIAQVLREARDLMNSGGRHWIKGSLEQENDDGSWSYCSAGGIEAATNGNFDLKSLAMEALVKEINPVAFSNYENCLNNELENAQDEWDEGYNRDYFSSRPEKWDDLVDIDREDQLVDIIATWNDAEERKWIHIKTAFSRAARNLR